MKRAFYDVKPQALEAVGNGNYLYRWDVQEEEILSEIVQEQSDEPIEPVKRVQYSCCEATIIGTPTYDKCVEAVIRDKYTAEQEMALVNKYNSYLNSVTIDSAGVDEYNDYLKYIFNAKMVVKRDLELEEALVIAKEKLFNKISEYDKSDEVNGFLLNGELFWLDRETRMSVSYSTSQEKALGNETTTIWLGGKSMVLPCEIVLWLLSQLEVYAKKCYNKTAEHKAAVDKLKTLEDVESYDYKSGYPERLNLEV
jgi:hypothetical protein|nr:MAG TPA: protein of unknown function (DUF4376) [Crassvirales sp.]